MTSVRIDIDGIDQVRKFYVRLPEKVDRNVSKANLRFMENVRDTAKKLAPRDTGSLAEDIKLAPIRKGRNVKVWKIQVNNPAGAPQEFGFIPHWAPIINSSKIPPGIYFVRKNTPFLRPALEQNLSKYAQRLNVAVRGSIIR